MTYVDGFVLPVPQDKLDAYKAMAEMAGKMWIEHGALSYKECVIEDATPAMPEGAPEGISMLNFPALAHAKAGETVIFAFITFKSRAHRDEVNAKVHSDMRMAEACGSPDFEMSFDINRMAYGGFKTLVDL